jgi:23S rRNA pseudouridine2605 synthase
MERPRRPPQTGERLQKILAAAGLGSRRACEDLIRAGQVTINGEVAVLGARADPARDSIKVAGKRVWAPTQHRYLLLNKPRGFVTTVRDPEARPTVIDLVPDRLRRGLRPVGRLDFDTEGLLLLTDDGDFAMRVSHPRFGCKKTYEVKVKGMPDEPALDKLRRGMPIEGRMTAPSEIRPRLGVRRHRDRERHGSAETARGGQRGKRSGPPTPTGDGPGRAGPGRRGRRSKRPEPLHTSWWVVRLAEGRTRQIREMFLRIGHPVQKLRRIAIGPLRDPRLPVGAWRELSSDEVHRLGEACPAPRETLTGPPARGTRR